uniref:Uncharacterized protein n=1 Tax=Alexandrium monilatum TaxID=311494 RepID=A0A7S4SS29_9DINO
MLCTGVPRPTLAPLPRLFRSDIRLGPPRSVLLLLLLLLLLNTVDGGGGIVGFGGLAAGEPPQRQRHGERPAREEVHGEGREHRAGRQVDLPPTGVLQRDVCEPLRHGAAAMGPPLEELAHRHGAVDGLLQLRQEAIAVALREHVEAALVPPLGEIRRRRAPPPGQTSAPSARRPS